MKAIVVTMFSLSILSVSCKNQGGDSTAAGVGDSTAVSSSDLCGVVELTNQFYYLRPSSGQVARLIEPQDGASSNALKDAVEKKSSVCIKAEWSSKDPVMITSASAIRVSAVADAKREECGTIFWKQNQIVLQVSGNNSESNADHILEPEDGAVYNVLRDLSMKVAQVCITADFSKTGRPVTVTSVSAVRDMR